MRRRSFITLLGGATATWPLVARAQQPGKLPTIGFMGESTPAGQRQWVAAFAQRLSERGWIEGRNVAIEYRWAEGRNERFPVIVDEFVRLKVDVVVTQGTPAVIAAKRATPVIPVVFAIAGNPVANGLVASLARPGGNVTGLTNQSVDLASKRIELLREVVPGLRRLAIMAMSTIQALCWTCAKFKQQPKPLASKSRPRKSGEPTTSRALSRRSRAARTHFMSPAIHS